MKFDLHKLAMKAIEIVLAVLLLGGLFIGLQKLTRPEKKAPSPSLPSAEVERRLLSDTSIAPSSSADDQKRETQGGGSTTAPEGKTP